jgi:hypothetical protein
VSPYLVTTLRGSHHRADDPDHEHLPDLEHRDLFASTFALLCVIELQNVLDFRSYVYPLDHERTSSVWYGISLESMTICDVNAIPHQERLECIYTRGLATELASWIFSRYDLIPEGRMSTRRHQDLWRDFYWPYLAHFIVAIKMYKRTYPEGIQDARGCTVNAIDQQMLRCVGNREELKGAIRLVDGMRLKSITPAFPFSSVVRRDRSLPFVRECL